MKYIKKAMEIEKEKGSGMNIFQIIQNSCPSDYGFKDVECECIKDRTAVVCMSCWNREMPNTEPQVAITKDDLELEYSKGLNDAWELVKKIVLKAEKGGLNYNDFKNIFGVGDYVSVLENLTPQEAIAKLKAYEEAQKIEVGDVVFCSLVAEDDNDTENKDNYGVVTGIYRDHYEILMKNGDTTGFKKENCKKTGKHLDLASILEQIGE